MLVHELWTSILNHHDAYCMNHDSFITSLLTLWLWLYSQQNDFPISWFSYMYRVIKSHEIAFRVFSPLALLQILLEFNSFKFTTLFLYHIFSQRMRTEKLWCSTLGIMHIICSITVFPISSRTATVLHSFTIFSILITWFSKLNSKIKIRITKFVDLLTGLWY